METFRPHVRTIPIHCAPCKAPCPMCGKPGRRKQVLHRQVRSIEHSRVVILDITYGEYRSRCRCCSCFRTCPPGVEPKAQYDNKVRQAGLDRILDDGMSVERVIASMRRDFLLDLSDGFVYDCLDREARRLEVADHRRWVLERFSGTPCVDELQLGRTTFLLPTDPLQDLPVAVALVASNDTDHMRRFLKNLKAWGLSPEVVVTDGSNLCPAVLAELWPGARHQLSVFHVLNEPHQHVLDAVRRLRRGLSRRGNRGRRRRPGRRPEGRARKTLRDFVDDLGILFEEGQSETRAWGRHAAMVSNHSFLAVPELAEAIEAPAAKKFVKMIAFLKSPACRRVRTNNHVERVNRKLRYEEKARYRWRKRRTTVRFVVLLLDRYWRQERAARNRWPDEARAAGPGEPSEPPRRRRVA